MHAKPPWLDAQDAAQRHPGRRHDYGYGGYGRSSPYERRDTWGRERGALVAEPWGIFEPENSIQRIVMTSER